MNNVQPAADSLQPQQREEPYSDLQLDSLRGDSLEPAADSEDE